jgi:hypothetical protein
MYKDKLFNGIENQDYDLKESIDFTQSFLNKRIEKL